MTEGKPGDQPSYCCAMRARFVIGIIAEIQDVPVPTDAVDFIDFDVKSPDGRPVLTIKYCPFCGKAAAGPKRTGSVRWDE